MGPKQHLKRRIDGRTAKGLRIRQEVREQILGAYIDLIRGGTPMPTAREIAEHAGLSLRVIFKHFSDLRALRLESFNRMQAQSSEFFAEKLPEDGPAVERLERFVQRHTRRLEFVAPIHRTAAMVESIDRDVAQGLKRARDAAARDLRQTLGSALNGFSPSEKRELLTALHVICSWNTWEFLRTHYRLSAKRAQAIVARIADAVLADAERRAELR